MTAKQILVWSSVATVVLGVAGMATLGAVAKVPSGEYWTVVLGGTVVGIGWLALLRFVHLTSGHD